jgi:hypothetical protein
MKRKLLIQSGITLVVLFILAFGVSVKQAYATTGCFTDTVGNWAETFICWMKDKGITGGVTPTTYAPNANVTRAEMAVFMQRIAEIPPTTGDTYINTGPSGWVSENPIGRIYYTPYSAMLMTTAVSAGGEYYMISPSLPSSLYNTRMMLKGVKLCYNATYSAPINSVELIQLAGDGTFVNSVLDSTVRNDATCRTYLLTSPSYLWGGDKVTLEIVLGLPSTSYWVYVSSATFIISPSIYPAILSPSEARPVPGDTRTAP